MASLLKYDIQKYFSCCCHFQDSSWTLAWNFYNGFTLIYLLVSLPLSLTECLILFNFIWVCLYIDLPVSFGWSVWLALRDLFSNCIFLHGKGEGRHFSYLIFLRFIIFTFRNYFTLCKTVLCIWRKIIFFCHHNFMKKGHSKLSKNEPENIP